MFVYFDFKVMVCFACFLVIIITIIMKNTIIKITFLFSTLLCSVLRPVKSCVWRPVKRGQPIQVGGRGLRSYLGHARRKILILEQDLNLENLQNNYVFLVQLKILQTKSLWSLLARLLAGGPTGRLLALWACLTSHFHDNVNWSVEFTR